MTLTTSGSIAVDAILIGVGSDSSTFSYVGNTTDGILIWGPQLEISSSVTGFLPNETNSTTYPGLTTVTRGVNGTTAQAASSGDSIQQLPFAFQQVTTTVTSTLSEDIDATQNYVPVASNVGFKTGVPTTIASTSEQISFGTITENLFLHSEDFSNSYWQKNNSSVNATGAVAPDGTSTAQGIREDTSSVSHNIIRNSFTTVIGQKYTISVFAKWTGQRYLQISFGSGDSNPNLAFQNFDIETGVLGSSSGVTNSAITDVGNGWYRCSTVVESAVTTGFIPVFGLIPLTTSGRSPFYTGQGNGAGDMLLLWGAQFEEGDSLTGYLPTTASSLQGLTTVTRGVNGTTAQAASSGASVSQTPSSDFENIPTRLEALSVSTDGNGAGRFTLADNNGDTLCDIDIPDGKNFDLDFGGRIIFPNGIYISNTDNIAGYTIFTNPYSRSKE